MPNNYTTMAICSPGHEFDVGKFNRQHEKSDLCAIVKPMPENVEQIPATIHPDGTTEPNNWHEWAQENWGTKWGTYDAEAFDLGGDSCPVMIKFQSAWRPPKILDKIAAWLKRVYKFEKVVFVGFNPFDDSVEILSRH
jgi:hypothetical protein